MQFNKKQSYNQCLGSAKIWMIYQVVAFKKLKKRKKIIQKFF